MKKIDPEPPKTHEPADNFRLIREGFETLAIALILAFLFKAFIIELYCIPTGSMASTLMGRHKDVNCEVCGFPFQLSASDESNEGRENPRDKNELPRVIGGTCPQCQYTMYVGEDNLANQTYMSFNGDRIFVNKSLFNFREPSRWHVTVFRYPTKPQVNYIKRLVGMENETVMLRNGQVFTQKEGEDHWEIQRKPLRTLLALLRPVDDNDYVLPAIHELGWKTRWYSDEPNWQRSADYKSFTRTHDGETKKWLKTNMRPFSETEDAHEMTWLKFRYITATTSDWLHLAEGKLPPLNPTGTPQLITDTLAYNTQLLSSGTHRGVHHVNTAHGEAQMCNRAFGGFGLNWVGDLAVRCALNVEKKEGVVSLRLVKGGITFQCDLDIAAGMAFFSIPDVPEFKTIDTKAAFPAGRDIDVMFCNVDEEMRLVIDGREVDMFGTRPGRYDSLCVDGGPLSRDRGPTALDLEPVAIGVWGTTVHVKNLKVMRNMYYISCDDMTRDHLNCDLIRSPFHYGYHTDEESIKRLLSTPDLWEHFGKTRQTVFKLEKDQFLMCGDNSAYSQDSRLWTTFGIPHYVERKFLIGEAVYVFWPHGHRIPGTRFPFIPNFQKMRWID